MIFSFIRGKNSLSDLTKSFILILRNLSKIPDSSILALSLSEISNFFTLTLNFSNSSIAEILKSLGLESKSQFSNFLNPSSFILIPRNLSKTLIIEISFNDLIYYVNKVINYQRLYISSILIKEIL